MNFSVNLKTFMSINLRNEVDLIIKFPVCANNDGHEIFNASVKEGIIKITKNKRLPINPKTLTKFKKMNFPIIPPDESWGNDSPEI